MIKKRGTQWVLYNHTGKRIISKHRTKKAALRQERAIWASKRRRGQA